MSECKICGYNSSEVLIINNLCSVHTCEICKREGYATAPNGAILCYTHEQGEFPFDDCPRTEQTL